MLLARLQQLELAAVAVLPDESGPAALSRLLVPVPLLHDSGNDGNGRGSRSGTRDAASSSSSQLARFRFRRRALWAYRRVLELLRIARARRSRSPCSTAPPRGRGSTTPNPMLFLRLLEGAVVARGC